MITIEVEKKEEDIGSKLEEAICQFCIRILKMVKLVRSCSNRDVSYR